MAVPHSGIPAADPAPQDATVDDLTAATLTVTGASTLASATITTLTTTLAGELGGTPGAATVNASHSGSTHAATQAAAEATAATALADHAGAVDPHAGYVQESAVPGGELGGTYASPTVDASHAGGTHAATQAAAEATAAVALAAHAADSISGTLARSAFPAHTASPGSGSLTADPEGRITVIDNARFNAFPAACLMGNGAILVVWQEGTNANDGALHGSISTDGINFGTPFTILDNADDLNPGGLMAHPDGRVFLSVGVNDLQADSGLLMLVSSDYGRTWTQTTPTHSYAYSVGCWAPPVIGQDGRILLPIQGRNVNGGDIIAAVLVSDDNGLTFGGQITISAITGKNMGEPNVVYDATTGNLVALIRQDTDKEIYRSVSTDNGATWSAAVTKFAGFGRPAVCLLASGASIVIYRKAPAASNQEVVYRVSWDLFAADVGTETDIDTGSTLASVHAAPIELASGLVAGFYSEISTPGGSDAQVYVQYFTDGSGVDIRGVGRLSGLYVGGTEITFGHGARVYASAGLTAPNGTTTLGFNSERRDTDSFHDTVTNNSRLTVPAGLGGVYAIGGNVQWDSNATGYRVVQLIVDGTTIIARDRLPSVAAGAFEQGVSTIYPLTEGQYVELQVVHNSGVDRTIAAAANYSPEFWMERFA